jgi:cyclopropane fatty-acyl-phospholipid synthase-like methyltransferase
MTAFRDFPFPLNVLLTVLEREEGSANVRSMHYGLFESPKDSIATAQDRSTALLLSRLPPPPARLLEVGIGLGTTLARLARMGYDAEGITPDSVQAAAAKSRHGEGLRVHTSPLEYFEAPSTARYDAVFFQESSQYIESDALFRKVRVLGAPAARVVVLDEFALEPVEKPGALHRLDLFLEAARREGFRLEEDLDVSRQAMPTIDWFLERIPKHRAAVEESLGVNASQLDALLASGRDYRALYESGAYGYRLLRFASG